jgi:pimeloyl-ACP methyl ester carboxylesterase
VANPVSALKSGSVGNVFWLITIAVDLNAAYDCIKASSETNLTEDLKKIDVPTLIVHGDDDQLVPTRAGGRAQPDHDGVGGGARVSLGGGNDCLAHLVLCESLQEALAKGDRGHDTHDAA